MKHYLRYALRLGTGLTALFLLVRCTVTPRDYSELNIGNGGGSGGGSSGNAGDGMGGNAAGQGGGGGEGEGGGLTGQGGQDAGPTIEPIPCEPISIDAGSIDAGSIDAGDAGSIDAGIGVNPYGAGCACVDGFIQAIDADGDGVGTRECSSVPGLDCDDGDGTVTHNACGGCTELPNAVGGDCLECGAYVCDGPEAVECATKPDAVIVDPDCRCLDALVVARDTDGDGEGTRLCEANPGRDCNDGDDGFVTNACGGCDTLPGAVGADCNQCGTYTCSGTAMVCAPKTGSGGRRCLDGNTRQTCVGTGFWSGDTDCISPTAACYLGACEICAPVPARYRCVPLGGGSYQLERCLDLPSTSSTAGGIDWTSWESCSPTQTCNATIGECTGYFLLPRDLDFDVVPRLLPGGLPWHELLNTASESDYG